MEIVDTHAHLYHPDEGRYPPRPEPTRPPAGTGSIEHLMQTMTAIGVTRVVAVQTHSFYEYDNRLLADLCREHREWLTGVCNVDLADPSASEQLRRYVHEDHIRGLRLFLSRATAHPEGTSQVWEAAQAEGVVILAAFSTLAEADLLCRYLERFSQVDVCLEHCGNLTSREAPAYPLLKQVEVIARRYARVYGRLDFAPSGSVEPYPCRDMHAILRRVIDAFGPQRCMWGGCFPAELWTKPVTYEQHLDIFRKELGLSMEEQRQIFEQTPMRLWFGERDISKRSVKEV